MIKGCIFSGVLVLTVGAVSVRAVPLKLHGRAWTDFGKVEHSTDTLQINYNGNRMQSMGMQFSGAAQLSERLQGGFGFGLQQVYHALGNSEQEKFDLSRFVNFVTEARLSYTIGEGDNPFFRMDVGEFPFSYAPHVKNLGLYLFRGPVYPGFLISGFKEYRTDSTRSGFLGMRLHNGFGNFQHDILINSEKDLPPSFDWSLGYVARYKAFGALELGAGVNFYHLISENEDITSPNRKTVPGLLSQDSSLIATGVPFHPYQLHYMEVVGPGDTVLYSHRGTKLMAMFSFDIKKALGLGSPFGEKDLQLYGEGALIGVKDYGSIYGKKSERMPFMVGFHFPAFGLLDFLSIEVERYTAKYKADYSKLGYDRSLYFKNISAPTLLAAKSPSATPISLVDMAGDRYTITPAGDFVNSQTGDTIQVRNTGLDPENQTGDDWKWSVNIEKTFAGHIQFSGQIANDHFVPRPVRKGLLTETGGLSEILTTTKDWYYMVRVGYFF
jgi:hypothetical protein